MQTTLGTPYSPPTPEEMQALVRRAHAERAQALRAALAAVFGRHSKPESSDMAAFASLKRAA
jgi:hypothetical protein